jgi:hypothetical protein
VKVSADDFRKRYGDMPDGVLLALDRNDLVDRARECYDEEIARRGLEEQRPATDYEQPVEFRVGDVVVRSWRILSHHFPTFCLLTGAALLPQFLFDTGVVDLGPSRTGISTLSQVVLGTFAQAVVVFAAFQGLRGRRVSAGRSAARGMARFLPAILTSFVASLIIVLGLVLLVVPGLIAAAAYSVAIPVCVVESAGTGKSLSRSAALTRGCRLRIMAVYAAYLVIEFVVSLAIAAALPAGPLAAIADWVWTVITTVCSAVFAAILYHDLRAAKEGIGIEEIAAVFD